MENVSNKSGYYLEYVKSWFMHVLMENHEQKVNLYYISVHMIYMLFFI